MVHAKAKPRSPRTCRCLASPSRLASVLALVWLACAIPIVRANAKTNVSFSIYAVTGTPLARVTLRTLACTGGASVSGLSVQFAVDGRAAGSSTSTAAGASLPYTIPSNISAGVHYITVSVAEDDVYSASSRTTAALTVTFPKTAVAFSLYPSVGYQGGQITLKTLMTSVGQPVMGRLVQFSVDGSPVGTAYTCLTGASLTYSIPTTMPAGPHNVTADFAGDATHYPASRTTAALSVRGNISFSIYRAMGFPQATVALRSLVYCGKSPAADIPVEFAVDGSPAGAAVTDPDGATINYTISPTMSPGVHNVTVTFAGDAYRNAATRTTPALTVRDSGLQPGSPWPIFHQNSRHTGVGVGSGAAGTLKWRAAIGTYAVLSSPAIATDGTVYVGNNDGYVCALNPGDGSFKWSYKTGSYLYYASPAVGIDGTVFIGSSDHYLYALNAADGSLKWRYQTGGDVQSSPAIGADGTLYVGSADGFLYALYSKNGSLRWRYQTGGYVESSPAFGPDGTVYVGSLDGYVYAISPVSGSLRWRFKTGDGVHSSPAVGPDGTVYVGSWDSYIYALSAGDGSQKWAFKTGSSVYSSPAIGADGTIYVGSNDTYFYALNPADGSKRWTYSTYYYTVPSSAAIAADGTVYVASDDGYLNALDPNNGKLLWKIGIGYYLYSSPAVGAGGIIYIGSDDGCVYAIK